MNQAEKALIILNYKLRTAHSAELTCKVARLLAGANVKCKVDVMHNGQTMKPTNYNKLQQLQHARKDPHHRTPIPKSFNASHANV